MAAARFQIFSVIDRVPVPGIVVTDVVAAPTHRIGAARVGPVTWRFMSANNRSIGRAVRDFPDVDSCLSAVRELRRHLACATCVTLRDGPRHWMWRVRVGGTDHAVSSRRYERRVQAKNSGESFLELVGTTAEFDPAELL